ncbi:MAG: DUF3373 domain-containing protein [Proteobacteria bacterium]|nr:DUF3373 domain-containing protein [Pseudomonadota bacterium]MBU1717048.1 DUF3373 domain-containing protein [Pseudomonadota bacterium]
MRRILLTLAVLLAWTCYASAGEIVVKIPVEEYQSIKKKLEDMETQISDLENQIKAGAGESQSFSTSRLKKMDKSISDIYDTLDEVETKSLLDRVNIGGELRFRMDNYQVKDFDEPGMGMFYDSMTGSWNTTPTATDERNDGNWSSRFRLNLKSEISNSLTFHGRLSLMKNWADSMASYSDDTMRSHRASGDADLKVDRFYIDWAPKFFLPVALTIGRQPTTDGPPYEFKEDRERQATYPALIFDGEPDGLVVTLGLEKITKLKYAGLRYFFAMAYQYDADTQFYLDGVYKDTFDDVKVDAVFFEAELPKLRDSLLVLSYIKARDFFAADPAMTGSMATVGDMEIWGVHLQLRDLFGSGLDLFGSYGQNQSDPNGKTVTMNGIPFSMMDGIGRAQYVGLRYELPIHFLNLPKIGVEYNKGSEYWFSFTPGSTEIFNKLATRGTVFDYYYIQPFNKNIFMRTGYTEIEYDYTGTANPLVMTGGTPTDYEATWGKKPKFSNFYVLLDCHF